MTHLSTGEKIAYGINLFLLAMLAVVTLFPILYVVSVSITPIGVLAKYGRFQIIPREITFDAYQFILFQSPLIPRAFWNSFVITALGTTINMVLTAMMAYPLSRKRLPFRNFWLAFVLIPMLFSGGLIPLFILVRNLGMINTYWAVTLPGAIATFNLLIMKSFFESIPDEIIESAQLDGASDLIILPRIILPLSKPVLATLGLFYGVGHWNNFFHALMFLNSSDLFPLQVVLRNILTDVAGTEMANVLELTQMLPGETMKMAAVVISVAPLIVVYPWLQKHFTKGVLLGSIKG
jgi:putative aldouronate transport system permease protein